MILESGNRVLVSHRRLFAQEAQRFFVGEVLAYDAGVAKLRGYSFVVDSLRSTVLRKDDPRTKIISLLSSTVLVYQLPDDTAVESARFESGEGGLVLTDDANLTLTMAEALHPGRI